MTDPIPPHLPRDTSPPNRDASRDATTESIVRFALLGHPNSGKTTLFNRLCGLRAKTANYPGVTVDARVGTLVASNQRYDLIDLPGTYGLDLEVPEARFCCQVLNDGFSEHAAPERLLIVVDSTHTKRSLKLVAEAMRFGLPTVIALNMSDLAKQAGIRIDVAAWSERLGCPVVPINARQGDGTARLIDALAHAKRPTADGLQDDASVAISDFVAQTVTTDATPGARTVGERRDRFFLHPVTGTVAFVTIMTGLFVVIFSLAALPMDAIEQLFGFLASGVGHVLPAGDFRDFIVEGVIGGLAGTLVFLPQICLLFFLLTLLEDTGYLARAALLIDRPMRLIGLPGQAFVPLLSSHACALPGIMSTKLIPDFRDRLRTIFIAPFMSCSARLPVYTLLIGLLFPDRPVIAGLAFAGCYLLGILAALVTATILRFTLIPGRTRPMAIELPSYRRPSLRTALITTYDRGLLFVQKAGTVILVICMVLWWLKSYPAPHPEINTQLASDEIQVAQQFLDDPETDAEVRARAEEQLAIAQSDFERFARADRLRQSIAGRAGRILEPLFAPIGCDWRLTISILTSFAAREVFASTLLVTIGQPEDADLADGRILTSVRRAKRDNLQPLFDPATASALLVFYVLALQCLPTLAVTRRESRHGKWAYAQFAYMSALAYAGAWLTHRIVEAMHSAV